MECYTYISYKKARELAEMRVYMGWYFEMEHTDDPSDPFHSYGTVQAYDRSDNKADHKFMIAADRPEDLNDMWKEIQYMIRKMYLLITTESTHK